MNDITNELFPAWAAWHQYASCPAERRPRMPLTRKLAQICNGRGLTLLHAAIGGDNVPAIQQLLDIGADCEALLCVPAGYTPLLYGASLSHRARAVLALLRHGVNIHTADAHGYTALHHLALRQSLAYKELLVELIRQGADVNRRTSDGWTPLMLAARIVNIPHIRLLRAAGAPPIRPGDWNSVLVSLDAANVTTPTRARISAEVFSIRFRGLASATST